MADARMQAIDGNSAVARVAHALSEVIAIYPITPSSPMGELADELSARGERNLWGSVPEVVEMQSEGGASGAVHGALASGALSTTFTASQGLLLMIPNMHKIAAELLPTCFHVSARSLACQALSIFGDHSDVMSVRNTGFCMMASGSVQEAQDMALIATAAGLGARLPFLHFFDGFRTSHEISTIELLEMEQMRAMIDDADVIAHRSRGLSPDHPMISGTSQNPDVYFQGRETVNRYYLRAPETVADCMRRFAELTGRVYEPFQYVGSEDAERVLVLMGSGCETAHETVELLASGGERVGVLKVRLYRPFSAAHLAEALPATVRAIGVLDRTKEPGSPGEPLYLDVVAAVDEMLESGEAPFAERPLIVGGRYGLSSKEFTPGMVKAVLDSLEPASARNHFTIGIEDDVTGTSLPWTEEVTGSCGGAYQAMFWGLGSDGTVSANKNTIRIVSEATDRHAQGYFVYDSKKAGARTTSHLRISDRPIRSTYLCHEADFVGCHNWSFIEKYDMLRFLREGGVFLLNAPYGPDRVWERLPAKVQCQLMERSAELYVVDGTDLARELELGARINTLMQAAFFKLSGIIPLEHAVELIRGSIRQTYGRKGEEVVRQNFRAVDRALESVHRVELPETEGEPCGGEMPPAVPEDAPDFVREVTARLIRLEGDSIPVSRMPEDGRWPTGTTRFEKRNVAVEIPEWHPELCIQCGLCSLVCPHATVRMKAYPPEAMEGAPGGFRSIEAKGAGLEGLRLTVQVAPEDCTGCANCYHVCPAESREEPGIKAITMRDMMEAREEEAERWDFFLSIPDTDRSLVRQASVKGSQLLRPLFEFSGACAGCGETPYVKLVTQLFGDRLLASNATGCSSIYGGNLPTTPYCTGQDGLGPAWTNSLFEDAAEIGLGFRLTCDRLRTRAEERLAEADYIPDDLRSAVLERSKSFRADISAQRRDVASVRELAESGGDGQMASLADYLVRKSVWAFGGDGWAYDIGYGGLDHVMASGRDVNVLVLDTEVYSNTGGQMSKATSRGSTAKFAYAGKPMPKKDLGLMMQSYGYVYVAQVAMGAKPAQTVRAMVEAESYEGPSIVICYSPCIAHGIDMSLQLDEQDRAVRSGHWILYRFDPRRARRGENPLQLDSGEPTLPVREYMYGENRYRTLERTDPERAEMLAELAEGDVRRRWNLYRSLSTMPPEAFGADTGNGGE